MKTIEITLKIDGQEVFPQWFNATGVNIVRITEPEDGVGPDHPLYKKAIELAVLGLQEMLEQAVYGVTEPGWPNRYLLLKVDFISQEERDRARDALANKTAA
jgi:hypothetical protein